jgi:hypothetical protein
MKNILVTTADAHQPYEIIGPVYFQISNKGVFSSQLGKLKKQYDDELKALKAAGQTTEKRNDWGALYGEFSVGQNDFDAAFFIAVQELKKRADLLGADAIVGMSQDIDLDTQGFTHFYLQMCGTAVRFI